MPDPTLETVSASQVPGLWNQSPYLSRWMLWHHLRDGMPVDVEPDDRMNWGVRLEHVILQAAAEEFGLDIEPHDQRYVKHAEHRLGATRDARIIHPEWGVGAVEAKNVDWLRWRDQWTDQNAPQHIEAQLQTQMLVGDGTEPYQWGLIACLVGGNDLKLYLRKPNQDFWQVLVTEVEAFFESFADGEPDVLGLAREIPGLHWMYPELDGPPLVVDPSSPEYTDVNALLDIYSDAKDMASLYNKARDEAKVRLLALMRDREQLYAGPWSVHITRTEVAERTQTVKAHVRDNIRVRMEDAEL